MEPVFSDIGGQFPVSQVSREIHTFALFQTCTTLALPANCTDRLSAFVKLHF